MILSTTLTASNADLVGDALASIVAHVDRCLVIDTGACDDTLEVARRVAGEKLLVREFPWRDDFAAARNFALHAATEAGGQWAVTVDTDERLLFDPGVDLRVALAASPARVLLVSAEDGSYAKERILRLPARERWAGPTHESLGGQRPGESAVLADLRFRELPKDEAALRRKLERDVGILRRHVKQHAKEPRWHYYLGATHHDLGQFAAAIDAYKACAALGGWPEEGAWACIARPSAAASSNSGRTSSSSAPGALRSGPPRPSALGSRATRLSRRSATRTRSRGRTWRW